MSATTGERALKVGESEGGSFDEFFTTNFAQVARALALVIGSTSDAEECAQEAFARAYRVWGRVSRYERPATWVYVVALNHRRRSTRRRRLIDGPSDELSPDTMAGVDARLDLELALRRLTERQRLAVVLRFVGGLSAREASEVMGCAEATVRSTVYAALQVLRIGLADEEVTW